MAFWFGLVWGGMGGVGKGDLFRSKTKGRSIKKKLNSGMRGGNRLQVLRKKGEYRVLRLFLEWRAQEQGKKLSFM